MPLKYRTRLLKHLEHDDYEPKPIDALGEELRVEDMAEFADAVRALAEEGAVVLDKGERVALPSMPDEGTIEGIFRGTAKGFGFVEPLKTIIGGDVFIPPHATLGALSGDTVIAGYSRDFRRERQQGGFGRSYSGEVVEVVKRKRSSFAGEMEKRGDKWLCLPDGRELSDPVVIRDASSKNVKPGDKVVIELLEYPEDGMLAEGVIVKVLGEAGEPDVETAAVIAAYGLPANDFPESCVQQARDATQRFDDEIEAWQRGEPLELREDRTEEYVTTIDPPDAKDYDDAISIEKMPDGGWELRVHIADVAHFIAPGSPLDLEAIERGNSCYLPRLVIPMLPEVLSNGICSLQEGVPRYAKTAIMRYDQRGNIKSRGVCSSLIKSTKRMTYLEAQALIDGDPGEAEKHAKTDPVYTDKLIATVKEMDTLARAIRERRRGQGMIHLELPDVELVFDEDGRVIDAEQEDDAFTHTIIEMFMVEANECLASLFADLGVPLLRRVHPEPTPGETGDLQKSARVAGYQIPRSPTREELQGLLDATRGKTASRAVHMAVLRTLTKAVYSPALIGHFALASKAYAHFTSPIRRYPDLTVHRALSEYLRRTDNGADRPKGEQATKALGKKLRESPMCPNEEKLLEIGNGCSQTEVNAADAERQLRQFLVLQLLAEQLASGENPEYPGVVTGVNPRGIFIQLDKYLADGMINKQDLPGDVTRSKKPPKWQIDDRTGALVDLNSGRSFTMGDRVNVCVAKVDLARRQMDLVLSDPESRAGGKQKGPMGLTIGSEGGGLEAGKGAGVKVPGSQRRSRKSKQRDKGKSDHRSDRKNKGKRQ